jgi:rhodanese-related sulfurtransferase
MKGLRPAELDERLSTGTDLFVLDIRPEGDYEADAIDGSHNAPVYDELRGGDDAALRNHLDGVPSDRAVVVVCKMGFVAKRATDVLTDEGYEADTLAGGMHGWNGYQDGTLGYKLRSLLWWLF